MLDVASLISMVNQTSQGTKPSNRTHGGFVMDDRRSGGFSAPHADRVHQAQMRSIARMDPRVSFINAWGERESGWQHRHFPMMPLSNYQRILNMVQDANAYERIRVTAPPGTVERQAQLGEQMGNPAGIRERRRTVRQILTGR